VLVYCASAGPAMTLSETAAARIESLNIVIDRGSVSVLWQVLALPFRKATSHPS
jgi:hypothetical protein